MKQSGNLDTFIGIYKPIETPSRLNQIRKDFELYDEDWAERTDLLTIKDSERVQGTLHRVSFGITQFRLRYRDDITALMRFKDGNTWFEVVGEPMVQERNHWILVNTEQRDDKA